MKKIFSNILNICSAIFLFKFAFPKLSAAEISVKGFKQFAEVLPVDPIIYMYLVGSIELFIALYLIAIIFVKDEFKKAVTTYIGYVLLSGLLFGALMHEYFVRPKPVDILITYAAIFLWVSTMQFLLYFKTIKDNVSDLYKFR